MRVDTDATSDARASLSPPNPTSPPPDPRRDDSPRSSRPEGNRRDALARPRLVIREVATRSKGRDRASSRAARSSRLLRTSPPTTDRRSIRSPACPASTVRSARAPRRLPSPRLSRRDATRRRRDTHRPRSPRSFQTRFLATQPEEDTGELPTDPPPKYPHYVTRDDGSPTASAVGLDRSRARASGEDRMRRSLPVVLRNTGIVGHVEPPRGVDRTTSPTDSGDSSTSGESGNPRLRPPTATSPDRSSRRGLGDGGRAKMPVPRPVPRPGSQTPFRSRGGASQRARGCVYRVRAPETSVRAEMSAREFARCASTWNERGVLLCDGVAVPGDGKSGAGIVPGDGSGTLSDEDLSPALPSPGMVAVLSPALPSPLALPSPSSPSPGGDGLGGSAGAGGLVVRARAPRVSTNSAPFARFASSPACEQPPPYCTTPSASSRTRTPRNRRMKKYNPRDTSLRATRATLRRRAARAPRRRRSRTTRGANLCSARSSAGGACYSTSTASVVRRFVPVSRRAIPSAGGW